MEAIPADDASIQSARARNLYQAEKLRPTRGQRSAATSGGFDSALLLCTNARSAFLCVWHGPTRTNETTEAISNTKCTNPVMKSFRGPDKIRHRLIELVKLPVAPSAGQEGRAAVSERGEASPLLQEIHDADVFCARTPAWPPSRVKVSI